MEYDFKKFKEFDIEALTKSVKEATAEQILKKYINIVNNVLDTKRDEVLSRELDNGMDVKEIINIIDSYESKKDVFEKKFRSKVTVKRKGE